LHFRSPSSRISLPLNDFLVTHENGADSALASSVFGSRMQGRKFGSRGNEPQTALHDGTRPPPRQCVNVGKLQSRQFAVGKRSWARSRPSPSTKACRHGKARAHRQEIVPPSRHNAQRVKTATFTFEWSLIRIDDDTSVKIQFNSQLRY
jgi:hypothetical protein